MAGVEAARHSNIHLRLTCMLFTLLQLVGCVLVAHTDLPSKDFVCFPAHLIMCLAVVVLVL